MKKLTIAALLSGQMLAPPAFAAELAETRSRQMGTFAGIRLRMPLDGHARRQPIRAGLTVAPTLQSRDLSGETSTLIGESLEFGYRSGRPLTLSVAGTPVTRLGAAQDEPETEDEGGGPSTLGWVAIGAGALLLVTAGAGYLWLADALDCDPGDECS